MDRIVSIGRCQWRSYWRRFKRAGSLNAGNQGIILIFSVLILVRYLQSLQTAANDFSKGNTRVFESLLLGIFLVWLFPLAGNAGLSIVTRKLLHLPLTLREMFAVRILGLFVPPYSWIIVIGSLGICYPILNARNPVAGLIAALLFILFSAFVGLTLAHLLTNQAWRRLIFFVLLVAGFGFFFFIKTNGAAAVRLLVPSSPIGLVTRAATGERSSLALIELAMLLVAALVAALWSFKISLAASSNQRTQRISIISTIVPGAIGRLAAKDFRYFRRLLDPYLGVLAAAIGCLYLASAASPSTGLLLLFILIVFLPSAPLAFDSFGLDNRAGLDRVKLLPVTGKTVLLGKNLAFVLIMVLQITPLLLLGTWRLGLISGLLALLEALALAAMYLAWGNWMSLSHPVKMQFFQFSNSTGLLVEAIAGLMFGSLPGALVIYFWHTEGAASAWKIVAVFLVSAAIYYLALNYFSSRFEQKQDRILNAIS